MAARLQARGFPLRAPRDGAGEIQRPARRGRAGKDELGRRGRLGLKFSGDGLQALDLGPAW